MRRTDREITDINKICEIIDSCKVLRLAMCANNIPYIVPLNYGYKYSDGSFEFYFHCANEGKKLDMLKENNFVCFELDFDHQLTTANTPCAYGYNYKSVIGMGVVSFVTNTDEKIEYLIQLMKHQTGKHFTFTPNQVAPVTVCKINVSEITAKQRSRPV